MGTYRVIKHEKDFDGLYHKYYTIEKLIYFPSYKLSLFGWEPLSIQFKTEDELNKYLERIKNPIRDYTRNIIKTFKI